MNNKRNTRKSFRKRSANKNFTKKDRLLHQKNYIIKRNRSTRKNYNKSKKHRIKYGGTGIQQPKALFLSTVVYGHFFRTGIETLAKQILLQKLTPEHFNKSFIARQQYRGYKFNQFELYYYKPEKFLVFNCMHLTTSEAISNLWRDTYYKTNPWNIIIAIIKYFETQHDDFEMICVLALLEHGRQLGEAQTAFSILKIDTNQMKIIAEGYEGQGFNIEYIKTNSQGVEEKHYINANRLGIYNKLIILVKQKDKSQSIEYNGLCNLFMPSNSSPNNKPASTSAPVVPNHTVNTSTSELWKRLFRIKQFDEANQATFYKEYGFERLFGLFQPMMAQV